MHNALQVSWQCVGTGMSTQVAWFGACQVCAAGDSVGHGLRDLGSWSCCQLAAVPFRGSHWNSLS